jgi:hypothetical protein
MPEKGLTLSAALLQVITKQAPRKPMPFNDVIAVALAMWKSSAGRTSDRTAATALLGLECRGLVPKLARGRSGSPRLPRASAWRRRRRKAERLRLSRSESRLGGSPRLAPPGRAHGDD